MEETNYSAKRPATAEEMEGQDGAKRGKPSKGDANSAATEQENRSYLYKEFLCPITLQLPFDPVMATDGKIYERNAIITARQNGAEPRRSPATTNEALTGPTLVPAIQTKTQIKELIKRGFISGDVVEKWNMKEKEQMGVDGVIKTSENDDGEDNATESHSYVHEHFLCPITLELPIDPVMAIDGMVYERYAIETHFVTAQAHGCVPRSPATNKELSDLMLLPASQTKSQIQQLIKEGIVAGEAADDWKTKEIEKKYIDAIVKAAERGDVKATVVIGMKLAKGDNVVVKKDARQAQKWFKQAANAGNELGTIQLGLQLMHGEGVDANIQEGTMWLGVAAGMGSFAAYHLLGLIYFRGLYGFKRDPQHAKKFFESALDIFSKTGDGAYKEQVDQIEGYLRKIADGAAHGS